MVKITYRPWSEIIIHEIIEVKPEELYSLVIRQVMASGQAGFIPSLNWVDGVAFAVVPMPDNDQTVGDKLNGIVHYAAVTFALVPEYKREVAVNLGGTNFVVRLERSEKNVAFVDLASFLKKGEHKRSGEKA